MPSHEIHERINFIFLIPLIICIYYLNKLDLNLIIFLISYIFATFFLSPDLDINSRISKRWRILRILWWPYQKWFKHRKTSHHIIFGPLSLIGYFAFLIFLLVLAVGAEVNFFDVRLLVPCAGMFVAIELHILSDMIIKKKRK